MSDDDSYITNPQILIGVFSAWKNARYFLEQSKQLNKDKKYQAAVPYATISLEESMKGVELLNAFRRKQNMNKEDWNKLKNHKHKLIHAKEEAAQIMEKSDKKDDERAIKELEEGGFKIPDIAKEKIIEIVKQRARVHSHFQNLREKCLYTDWDEIEGDWTNFSSLSDDRQDALSYFVLEESENDLEYLEFYIEKMINKLRKDGITATVPYPPYSEYREPDKYESIKRREKKRTKAEQIKYDQGLLVMKKFIGLNAFENVSFGMFRDTMLKYLRIIEKQDDDKWFAHPVVKAMIIALELAKQEDKDGNYVGTSGDADLTGDEKPFMVVAVVVQRKKEVFLIEKIAVIGHDDYKFTPDMIEKLLRTEIILERDAGKEVFVSTFIESLSVVGVKTKMIKKEELEDAFKFMKDMTSKGNLDNFPKDVLDEIKNKEKEDWDNMKTETRTIIVSTYGSFKYGEQGYNMFTTPVKSIEKYKARLSIMSALQQKYLDTA